MERCLPNRSWPVGRDQFLVGTIPWLQQTILGFEIFVVEPAIIAHPAGVNVIVFSRCLAIDYVLTSADNRVTACSATRADALRFFQEPDQHCAAEIPRSQGAHRRHADSNR